MRRLFTTQEAAQRGLTRAKLRSGEKQGKWQRIDRGVWCTGPEPASALDRARAAVLACGGVASGSFAAVLLELDGATLGRPEIALAPGTSARRPGTRRRTLPQERIVTIHGVRCTDALQTLLDLAPFVDDLAWERALESALRAGVVSLDAITPELTARPVRGAARIRRVLAVRPPGAPPTESLLETLMVQLARRIPGLPPPVRQHEVFDQDGHFVARIDLAWPELGLFVELDGEHHHGQPVHDARRETAIVAATGWLCGRFTWTELTRFPVTTMRRLAEIAEQCRRRPVGARR